MLARKPNYALHFVLSVSFATKAPVKFGNEILSCVCGSSSNFQNECPMKKKCVLVADGVKRNSEPLGDDTEHGDSEHIACIAMKPWTTTLYEGLEEAQSSRSSFSSAWEYDPAHKDW